MTDLEQRLANLPAPPLPAALRQRVLRAARPFPLVGLAAGLLLALHASLLTGMLGSVAPRPRVANGAERFLAEARTWPELRPIFAEGTTWLRR